MATSGVTITGFGELAKTLQGLEAKATHGAVAGNFAVANNIMTVAKERAPVDTGVMRASGFVDVNGETVSMGFGGASSDYVVRQHEDLTLRHPGGGQAKFLESAIDEAHSGAPAVIASYARKALLGTGSGRGGSILSEVISAFKEGMHETSDEDKQAAAEQRRFK